MNLSSEDKQLLDELCRKNGVRQDMSWRSGVTLRTYLRTAK